MKLIKPERLKAGDKVATISLSWGGAGDADILWRYQVGKQRLEQEFGLEVVEMPSTLKGAEYVYKHPEKRAQDLMNAFADQSIKGIFSCIGGDESVRLLPYIDYEVIRNNPKIFIGYSDTTVSHFICMKAGISSFYGPAILMEFAENVRMHEYTQRWVKKALFEAEAMGQIEASPVWTSELLPWKEENRLIERKLYQHSGYEFLQGSRTVKGHLIGGCLEVMEMLKGSEVWPSLDSFENSILFFETSEDMPEPTYFEYWLRSYGTLGILQRTNGIIFAKPYNNKYYDDYKKAITKVVTDELGLIDLPIILNMNFGHTSPVFTLPFGALAEIDCSKKSFSILEAAVK